MTFEVVEPSQIPQTLKAFKENIAIYHAARKLMAIGVGRALRVKPDDVSLEQVRKKAHVHFRFKPYKLRTKKVGQHLYMWIEERQTKRFDMVSIPAKKTEARRA